MPLRESHSVGNPGIGPRQFGPQRIQPQGVDTQKTGILTRSVGRLRFHCNAGYTRLGKPPTSEREEPIG